MSEHIVSFATGHQVSEGRKHQGREYAEQRKEKLKGQQNSAPSGVLGGTRIYIDGYLEGTTDIEMKRIIAEAGGQVMYVLLIPSGLPSIDPNRPKFSPNQVICFSMHTHPDFSRIEWLKNQCFSYQEVAKYRPRRQTCLGPRQHHAREETARAVICRCQSRKYSAEFLEIVKCC